MKVLFLSTDGRGLSVAHKIKSEGYDIDVFVKNRTAAHMCNGFLNMVESWRPHVRDSDFIVCDGPGWGDKYETLRGSGRPVFGCDELTDKINLDYSANQELLKRSGIPVEVSGEVTGVPIRLEGWWNGRSWLAPFFYVFPHTKLFQGDLGPHVEDMGSIVLASHKESKMITETSKGLKPFLMKTKYKGPVSIYLYVTEDLISSFGIYFGMVFDGMDAIMEGLREPVTDLLFETSVGVKKKVDVSDWYMVAVRYSISPWPYSGASAAVQLHGINENNLKHIQLHDVFESESSFFTGAHDCVPFKVTSRAGDLREALRRAYRTLSNLSTENHQYRLDIGADTKNAWEQLLAWKWV